MSEVSRACLDLDVESIRKLAHAGTIVGSGVRGRYLLAPSIRNYVRRLREIAAGRQGNELNAVDENARLKIVQRKNYELKNATLEGRLISVTIAYGNSWARRVSTLSSVMRDDAGGCSAHAIRTRISASSRSSCL